MPIVIDGSALAEVVLRSERAAQVEPLFEGHELCAPDLVNAEVLSVIRGMVLRGLLQRGDAAQAVANLVNAPVRRMTTGALIALAWALHCNVTPYDTMYVALARRLEAPLLTLDSRLARAPGLDVEILTV